MSTCPEPRSFPGFSCTRPRRRALGSSRPATGFWCTCIDRDPSTCPCPFSRRNSRGLLYRSAARRSRRPTPWRRCTCWARSTTRARSTRWTRRRHRDIWGPASWLRTYKRRDAGRLRVRSPPRIWAKRTSDPPSLRRKCTWLALCTDRCSRRVCFGDIVVVVVWSGWVFWKVRLS